MNNLKVRSGVFETNSSSTHSLSLSPTMDNMVPPPIPESMLVYGVMYVIPGEFGWEEETYHDVESKLSYLYTDAMSHIPYERDSKTIDPNTPESRIEFEKLQIIADAVKKYSGVDVLFNVQRDDYYPFGYIDHQSYGTCGEVWDEGVDGIIRFVFSNNSYFTTDNDNH